MAGLFKTSVARKVTMALSALFLILFLIIHFAVNFTSVISESTFNELSHFMGTNPLIQFAMQPVILLFLGLHLYDFWVGEMNYKYIEQLPPNPDRYYEELVEKFHNPVRVSIYVLAFIALALHLLHGFQSSFQSMGWKDDERKKFISCVGNWYSYIICGGFIFIALFHYFNHLNA